MAPPSVSLSSRFVSYMSWRHRNFMRGDSRILMLAWASALVVPLSLVNALGTGEARWLIFTLVGTLIAVAVLAGPWLVALVGEAIDRPHARARPWLGYDADVEREKRAAEAKWRREARSKPPRRHRGGES